LLDIKNVLEFIADIIFVYVIIIEMVFGAMTQANGFETGWNINNVRWTGDYIIVGTDFIGDIDINNNGSNIHFLQSLSPSNPINSNICTIRLASNYVLSSNIGLPIKVPVPGSVSTNGSVTGFSFEPTGNFLYFGKPSTVCNVYTANPFIVPNPFPTSFTISKTGLTLGFMSVTNQTWFCTPYKTLTATDKFIGRYSFNGPYTAWGGVNVLGQNKYNIGGHYGISSDPINRELLELSGFSITSNIVLLNRFVGTEVSNNVTATVINNRKKYFRNIYPLFPTNMKPTEIYGIVVDREKGQYLFVNALINSKWTICKFQLRAT